MTAPEVPHADLIARGQSVKNRNALPYRDLDKLAQELADALAALGDTVPRDLYTDAMGMAQKAADQANAAERERDESRAERDALAHVIEQVREWTAIAPAWNLLSREGAKAVVRIIDHAPVSLALHDAEVKAQALDEAAASLSHDSEVLRQNGDTHASWGQVADIAAHLKDRAAAIREEAANTIKDGK